MKLLNRRSREENPYAAHQHRLLLRYGKIIALISIPSLAFLLYMDLAVLKLSDSIILIRGAPLLFAAGYLLFLGSPLKSRMLLMGALHFLFLSSGMFMISALALLTWGGPHFTGAIIGMIVVIFGILMGSPFGAVFLAPVYLVPFAAFSLILFAHHGLTSDILSTYINPVLAILVALFLAEVQNRNRKKSFESNRLISEQNNIIAAGNLKIQQDLELARKVQHNLIPQSPPESPFYTIYTLYLPVQEVGGDYFDFIKFHEENRLGIIIGDVSGHGIHAALITSMVKMLVETSGIHRRSPERLLRYINENLIGLTDDNFFTAFYGIYDPDTRIFTYARGGHTLPVLIRENGEKLELLNCRGNLLGAFYNLTFEEVDIELIKGDKILFYTDGLTEARNSTGEEFEIFVQGQLKENGHLPINRLIQSLYQEMKEFNDGTRLADDICIVGLEILQ